jgi:DNA-binding MarR family transcriptional regulator
MSKTSIKKTNNQTKNKDNYPLLVNWTLDLYLSIIKTSITMEWYANKLHLPYKLRQPGIAIINVLATNGGEVKQKYLVKFMRRTKQSANAALKILLQAGYIVSEEAGNDRRERMIKLTEAGWEVFKFSNPLRKRFFQLLSDNVGREEGEKIVVLLKKIDQALLKDIKEFQAQPHNLKE